MARPPSDRPTPGELEILEVFWKRGRQTIRQVHEQRQKDRSTAMSSVATLTRIMVRKGHLRQHTENGRHHEFEAIITKEDAGRRALADLRDRLFGGSLESLITHSFRRAKPSASELAVLRKIIDNAKKPDAG